MFVARVRKRTNENVVFHDSNFDDRWSNGNKGISGELTYRQSHVLPVVVCSVGAGGGFIRLFPVVSFILD